MVFKHTYRIYNLTILLVGLTLCLVFSIHIPERIAGSRTPDGVHKHQVFKNNPITEEFIATARGLSALGIYAESQDTNAISHVIIKETTTNQIISEQDMRVKNLAYIVFPRQPMIGKRYSITISAEQLSKSSAIYIAYQSDATLDPTSVVTQAGIAKQGSLGLIEYERPTIAVQIMRWLSKSSNKGIWIGIFILCVSTWLRTLHPLQLPLRKGERTPTSSPLYFVLIFFGVLAMYWPATSQFFFSDDLPILARIPMLATDNFLQIFTPLNYSEPDANATFVFYFWRPISFAIYPFALYLLFGTPSAFLYYLFNIVIIACTSCLLFIIALKLFKSPLPSLLAVTVFVAHSSKIGLAFWWSSSQDILASFFGMLAIVLYMRLRETGQKIYKFSMLASFVVAIFSKEYVAVVPIAIIFLELYWNSNDYKKKEFWQTTVKSILPFFIIIGIFMICNTLILGNEQLVSFHPTDKQYNLTLQPSNLLTSSIAYMSATVEQSSQFAGIATFLLITSSVVLFWKEKTTRNIILFGLAWWFLFLGPTLMFGADIRPRWLTLSMFGFGLIIAGILRALFRRWPLIQQTVTVLTILSVTAWGFYVMRASNTTRYYVEQARYNQSAFDQLRSQQKVTPIEKRIIIVGEPEEQYRSLNAYLFRLYANNKQVEISYSDSLPHDPQQGDIIIDMSQLHPYNSAYVL